MEIAEVKFIKSSPTVADCPKPVFPEYAFAGRSNSGKSSLLNMIAGRKKVASISSTPGKTRLINHFMVNDSWYMVDLPGYGYARVSGKTRQLFPVMMKEYLLNRQNLACLFLLVDCRHEPLKNDIEVMEWLGMNHIPFVIVFTKTDKLSVSGLHSKMQKYSNRLLESWETLPLLFKSSALKNEGRNEILRFIEDTNKVFNTTRKNL